MKHEQMETRCLGSVFLKCVYLNNARFVYDGKSERWGNKAVANVISVEGEKVWGGLFDINEDNLAALDCHEGYPKNYGKKVVQVVDNSHNIYDAWVYFRIGQKKGEPSGEYREAILIGAKDCGLPVDYVKNKL